MWFFQGFCRYINPEFCALVDVGTQPEGDGLVQYYRALKLGDQNVAGVSGFMGVYLEEDQRKEDKRILDECIRKGEF